MSVVRELILPYRTDWREMSRVLEYCKGKGADRAALDARFGGGEALRETLNALEQLDLIVRSDAGDVRLTSLGERLAYAPTETEERRVLIEAMLRYAPYRIPLERALDTAETLMDAPQVERIWQVDMRLGQPRNRAEEARTFFFRLADDAGLGTYRRGVRGQTTRLELDDAFSDTIAGILAELDEHEPEPVPVTQPDTATEAPVVQPAGERPAQVRLSVPARPETTLSIQVDMSDWDLEKIEAFLQLIGYLDGS